MEDLFLLIIKESTGTKHNALRQTAQIAYDKLYRQHGIHRDPSHELRSVCFTALQMALDTKRPKFITMGLNGLHRVIKDERFYIGLEPEDDSVWLPSQLLRATNGILPSTSSEDTVVNVLRLFLAMACSPACTLNGRLLIEILSRCGECWEMGSRATKAASLAAASQCLRTFCAFLIEEAEEVKKTAPAGLMTQTQASAVYNEVIPVMQWLCSRLVEPNVNTSPNKKCENHSSLYLTECILTLSSALPRNVHANPHFTSFLWQKFCPTLAAALGSPGRINLDKKFTYKDALHMIENEARGFFTGPGLDGPQARCVYLTAIQLLRIAGAHGSLRPMLEALFHRMLLLPAPQNRTEPLRCVREIFKSPERLIDLAVILYVDKNTAQGCSDEMALFRLLVDAMEECAYGASGAGGGACTEASLQASVECMVALLDSLQVLCSGELTESMISDQIVQVVNSRHDLLKDADYSGPLTYQSMARLPAPYRDAIVEFRQNVFETSSGSESDGEPPNEQDGASNGSGDTEGPEDDEHSSSSDETSRVENRWPYSHLEAPVMPIRTDSDNDRQHARDFARALRQDLVPKLLRLRSCVELDEAMQEFASAVCQENSMNFSDFDYNLTAINADGIYLAIYSSLLLSLQLMRAGYYDQALPVPVSVSVPVAAPPNRDILVPMSEQQFVTSVQNTGVLVYLSSPWLCELYQSVTMCNILEAMTRQQLEGTGPRCALVDMLCDAGGLGATQMLSEWQRLQTATQVKHSDDEQHDKRREAAKKLCRRLLTCCWDSMVIVLSSGLGDLQTASASNKLVALSKRTLRVKAKANKSNGEALYAMCLDGLHSAATLSNSLNLQHLAGKILNLLASNVCQTTGPRISASQAMSMDVVLTGGLNLGSYSADCWPSIFAVCRHVSQLEHEIFSMQNPSISASPGSSRRDLETGEKLSNGNAQDKLNLSSIPIDDDETCVDVYSFLQAPMQSPNTNITCILKVYSGTNETVLLSQCDTSKVLCALSHQAENLFSDAAERLSLPSLCQFLKHLCRASRDQLYKSQVARKGTRIWWPSKGWKKLDSLPMSLLLHRIGDVTLKVFRSSRPLLHVLKVWAITGPHLMDAACHRDRMISKRAIEYIHDIITALLVEQSELPYFHFNEALLKPFENLLSMDTDVDVQDQIVACLYEVVEAHRTEIRSGWRPLFGTLRNARSRMLNMSNIIDIFRVFLDSDNTLVFANAGLDCILCLLSYLEISGGGSNNNNTCSGTSNGAGGAAGGGGGGGGEEENAFRPTDFLHETLRFLERCSSILGFMYSMPKCPNFHSTYKIKGISYTHIIDANIPSSMENFTYFGNDYLQTRNEQYMISYRSLHIDKDTIVKIDEMDKPSGVLKVWFLLLDGLTNSLIVCPYSHQAPILQTIFKLFKNLLATPGIDFGFYCINHLLVPMIQDWLRYINKTGATWQLIEKNFKHCCCMTTDLVVEFIEKSVPEQRRLGAGTKTRLAQIVHPADNLIYSKLKFVTERIEQQELPNLNLNPTTQTATDSRYDSSSSSASEEQQKGGSGGVSGVAPPPAGGSSSSLIESPTKISSSATLALKQLLLVLIECAAQSQEAIARISVSCLKHVILSTGMLFNESQWMIACSAIHRACTVTIAPLRQLSFAFHEKSNSFYGDCANVKVAARRDSSLEELARIYSLAQQVFLSDNQREPGQGQGQGPSGGPSGGAGSGQCKLSDDRSYSFLLYPLNNGFNSNLDNFVIRIPFKNLVVGLLANQMLLQLVAKLLLSRLKCVPQAVSTCIFDNYAGAAATPSHDYDLDFRSKEILLRCVKQYLMSALEFDSRPGLKFLMQKVSNIEYAANLYKQMTSSWMIYYIALVDSHLNDIVVYNLGPEDLNFILESCSRLNTTTVKKKENFVRYLFCLQDAWNLVCELYLSNSALHDLETGSSSSNSSKRAVPEAQSAAAAAAKKPPMAAPPHHPHPHAHTHPGHVHPHQMVGKPMCISLNGNGNGSCADAEMTEAAGSGGSPSKCVQLQEEENVTMTTLISEFQPKCRNNPFDTNRQAKSEAESISPEIEQQRASSILKDSNYKRAALAQLVVASMELLRSLPGEAEENLKLLMTPTIREAFRLVQLQGNELKVNQF